MKQLDIFDEVVRAIFDELKLAEAKFPGWPEDPIMALESLSKRPEKRCKRPWTITIADLQIRNVSKKKPRKPAQWRSVCSCLLWMDG